jgi:hypothetical protein
VGVVADSAPSGRGRIFISYRREETAYAAGWLYDRLGDHYGGRQVFKDVDSIELGDDFVEVITRAVGFCDVLLALIGDEWLTITDEEGRRRLDDPDDFVRLEIEAALARKVRIIPILVDGARMPAAKELPDSLAGLSRRQALELSPARFDFDTGRLLKVLDNVLADLRAVQAEPEATPKGRPASAATTPRVQAELEATPKGRPASAGTTPRVQAELEATPKDRPASAATRPPAGQSRRRSTRTWLLAGTGIAVASILLIVALLLNDGTTPSSTREASPCTSAGAATTSAPGATATTSAPANEPVVFGDKFSSRAAGWEGDGAVAEGTGYTDGAYRISAPQVGGGGGAGSAPMKASRVWPCAPPRIRIAVEGRMLPESDQSMSYGILCRINGDAAYVLTMDDGYAKIEKWGNYKMLNDAEPQVDPHSTNKLQAVCTGGQGREAVHLELWVNGEKVVEATDTDTPLPPGGVGLAVTTYKTKRASVAEFDNFVVEQLA